MKFSELDSLKIDNAILELTNIKLEKQLNDAKAEILDMREAARKVENKKLFESIGLKDKVALKRNPDGSYETQETENQ